LSDFVDGTSGQEREAEYAALVAARKSCRICIERSPGSIRSCAEFAFDPPVVSLWEQWLGHKRPRLLVVGQDFGNVAYFVRNRGCDEPGNKTNENLKTLLAAAGFAITDPPQPDTSSPIFLTNSILCLKQGAMSGPIRQSWVTACTERHLRPLLEWLQPPVVVGMGACGWRAVRQAFTLQRAPLPISRAAGCDWVAADGTRVFAVGHCGPLGLTNRPWAEQLRDWRRIGTACGSLDTTFRGALKSHDRGDLSRPACAPR
jgi:uracil-DNA glycosylase